MKPFRIQFIAHRLAAVVIVASVLAGCATSKEIELTLRVKELEQIVANKDDDLGYLMEGLAKQQAYIRELEMGAAMQADYINKIRRNCDL